MIISITQGALATKSPLSTAATAECRGRLRTYAEARKQSRQIAVKGDLGGLSIFFYLQGKFTLITPFSAFCATEGALKMIYSASELARKGEVNCFQISCQAGNQKAAP